VTDCGLSAVDELERAQLILRGITKELRHGSSWAIRPIGMSCQAFDSAGATLMADDAAETRELDQLRQQPGRYLAFVRRSGQSVGPARSAGVSESGGEMGLRGTAPAAA
jgi:hypothetical protein